ncbi:TetR/AcrR family transcriptional regulator [Lentzea cavernae]|uniref:TetR family transcriptional regulator n=1 Tax=Lentzea cavernae TaxID=2020703 RepID=A0ABQ3LY60_9PSEU|nr:TetR/AcrR family transcriptional regulator [Lentzea cavernae]GHH27777.1 TetR family transcriptional regulator [Lentzea cavernae]
MPRERLGPSSVTRAAADLADEVGFERLGMGLLARRLLVRTPSLYKHVGGRADLAHRVAVLATTELGDALRDATQGVAGSEALAAAARALRTFVHDHPGRYAAVSTARPVGAGDPLVPARRRLLGSLTAVLHGYRLDPGQELHALRMVRSIVAAFATTETAGGFQVEVDAEDSFTWMVTFMDNGLRAARS